MVASLSTELSGLDMDSYITRSIHCSLGSSEFTGVATDSGEDDEDDDEVWYPNASSGDGGNESEESATDIPEDVSNVSNPPTSGICATSQDNDAGACVSVVVPGDPCGCA